MSFGRQLLVLLPVYNEADAIEPLIRKIQAVSADLPFDLRIVAVDDGSTDGTSEVLASLRAELQIEVQKHALNRGLGETIRDLFERGAELAGDDDVLIRLDADDTHEPEYFPAMIAKLDEGYDVVIASRFAPGGGQQGLEGLRHATSSGANVLMKLVFPIAGVREYTCGFRAYRGRIVREAVRTWGNDFIQLKGLGFTSTLEKLIKLRLLGARIAEVPFTLRYDQKLSESKMLTNITTAGYLTLVVLYYWPWGGWRSTYLRRRR